MCSEPFERTRFLTFESRSKKLNCFNPPFTYILVENTFMILHLGSNFVSIYMYGQEAPGPSIQIQ